MQGYVATIGMFDGVHLGHQFVLQHVVASARENGLQPMAITFDHTQRREQLLTPLQDKLMLISQCGIGRVEVLPFTDSLKQMTAFEFMQHVLRDRFDVRMLLTGYDNRFGHNREEGFADYVRYGRELGIRVACLPSAGQVSSSLIRQQLAEGRVGEASRSLGRPYAIAGHVVHGEHVGTGLGYPTANLEADCRQQLVPAAGAYAVWVDLMDGAVPRAGMMNIGRRPTFGGHQTTLEVHIFQLHADLYGRPMKVSFVERLRSECRFDSSEALRQQLHRDADRARQLLVL